MNEEQEAPVPEQLMARSGFVMHKAGQRALQISNTFLSRLDIEVRHYSILRMVMQKECSQRAIAKAVQIDQTTLVQLVDDLERKKLVRRTVNPADRRAHSIVITPAGRRVAQSADSLTAEADEIFLAPLTPAERAKLLALLTQLI